MSEDQPEDAYELVMPFVACASNGGPYDDDAFTAGYVAGGLDKTLGAMGRSAATPHGKAPTPAPAPDANPSPARSI